MDAAQGGDRWRRIGTSTWSDALDRVGLVVVVKGLAWRSGATPVFGRAVTVREEITALGMTPLAAFDVGAMIAAAGVGDVLVVDMGGHEVSTFGGLAARAAAARGIEGVVIDGGCRDLAEVGATGLKLFSRHVTPTSGKQRARVVEINGQVRCGEVSVDAGDYVIADETGIVVVPALRFEEIAAVAEELDARDRRFEQALGAGQEFGVTARAIGHV